MTADTRLMLLEKRKYSEREGLKNDIVLWKKTLPPQTVIHHHVSQFEALSNWMIDRLDGLFESNPARWPNLDPSTFNSLIVSILSGKWVLLRQVAQQRAPSSPYLEAAKSLDEYADQCYQRLRAVLKQNCGLNGISESSPLVYLGPIARLFLFDEEAPCLISAPFAAANDMDEHGRELSRQTIPHEVGHAIFDQIAGMVDELKYIINTSLSGPGSNKKQDVIRSVILNWLEEMIADMAGTAVGGLSFAESARRLTVMPARMAGVTDAEHPIPLLRVFVHGWVLDQTDTEAARTFNRLLNEQITDQVNRPFESLPAVITATMQ